MRQKTTIAHLGAGVVIALGFMANAQGILDYATQLNLQAKPQATVDPSGYFSAVISQQYFACKTEPMLVQCVGVLPVKAILIIQVKDVPDTATSALVALNQLEQYEKQAHFKLIKNAPTSVDGIKAVVQTFTYDELANVDRPVWMQILSAVQGAKLVTVQMQCGSRDCQDYLAAVNQVFSTLKIAPLDKNGQPIKSKLSPLAPPSGDLQLDKIVNELEN